MKRITALSITLGLGLISGAIGANEIVYLQDCTLPYTNDDNVTFPGYGPGYFYVPGTNPPESGPITVQPICINASTGVTKQQIDGQTITGLSDFAAQVLKLETQLNLLPPKQEDLEPINTAKLDNEAIYVEICNSGIINGTQFLGFYLPGTSPEGFPEAQPVCLQPDTGVTAQVINGKLIRGLTNLAQRIVNLEMHLGISSPTKTIKAAGDKISAAEYVKVCQTYNDTDYYVEPGTDTCLNVYTMETKRPYTIPDTETTLTLSSQTTLGQRLLALETQLKSLN